jgi:hypothetical protein
MALLGLLIKYNEIKENNVSDMFTPLLVTKKSSVVMFLLKLMHCANMVPWAGPNPGNKPKIQPDRLPAKADFLNFLSISTDLSLSCGGIMDLEFRLYNKLLMLNRPDNMDSKAMLFPTLLFKTINPRIPETMNNNILFNLFSFLLNKYNKIIIVNNNKIPI